MRSPSRNYFKISFHTAPNDALVCWQLLTDYLNQHEAMPDQLNMLQLGQKRDFVSDAEGIGAEIAVKNLTSFWVHTGHTESSIAYKFQHNSFTCRIENKAKAPNEWGAFIEAIASRYEMIGGWQFFLPYRTWQNLREPSAFDSGEWGSFPPNYKVWHEPDKYGIGPGQTFFDKSKNPGHTKVIDGCSIFYPTAETWLGPHFWQYAKCTKEEALAANFWLETRDTPHFTYFKCWPTAFTRPDGEQGRMQQRLWKLFFHEDCEWPPGSGTICDEPMYGPPELMP
jgi:hypothetical protein